jgi:replicative DNA helicase
VFAAYRNLEAASRPIDPVTVEVELEKVGKLEPIGGVAFLGELALRVPTPENVEHYAAIVRECSTSRRVMLVLSEYLEEGYKAAEGYRGDDLISEVVGALMRIESGKRDPVVTFGEAVKREISRIESDLDARERGEQVLIGMPTGLRGIDERVGGTPFSVVTGVLARPATGKSTLADHLCLAAELYGNDVPLLFTFEDSEQSFAQRRIAGSSGVPTTRIRRASSLAPTSTPSSAACRSR